MKIFLANPRGFCAGVKRAISIVENAILLYGPPVYVRHEIVHNTYVLEYLRNQGAIFIEKISDVPDNATLIFSAHGVSKKIREEALSKNLKVLFDATCPLVKKVHVEVSKASRKGIEVILIGHSGHPEIKGTIGQYSNVDHGGIYLVESVSDVFKLKVKNENKLFFATQTTLSVHDCAKIIEALYKRFPRILRPNKDDICYATYNRQEAVRALLKKSDIILVIGSKNSSNSRRLLEISQKSGKLSKLIDSEKDINNKWFDNIKCIGITASASAPEILVTNVLKYLFSLGAETLITEIKGKKESTFFQIPYALRFQLRNHKDF